LVTTLTVAVYRARSGDMPVLSSRRSSRLKLRSTHQQSGLSFAFIGGRAAGVALGHLLDAGEAGWLEDVTWTARTKWKRLESIVNQSNPMISTVPSINPRATVYSPRFDVSAITSRASTEVTLNLAFEAADREDVTSAHVLGDAGDERPEAVGVVSTARPREGSEAPRPFLFLLGTDRAAEQLEGPARAIKIGGNGPLHGASQCEQVDLSQCANWIRFHWQQV
jgi:hypothetical protein